MHLESSVEKKIKKLNVFSLVCVLICARLRRKNLETHLWRFGKHSFSLVNWIGVYQLMHSGEKPHSGLSSVCIKFQFLINISLKMSVFEKNKKRVTRFFLCRNKLSALSALIGCITIRFVCADWTFGTMVEFIQYNFLHQLATNPNGQAVNSYIYIYIIFVKCIKKWPTSNAYISASRRATCSSFLWEPGNDQEIWILMCLGRLLHREDHFACPWSHRWKAINISIKWQGETCIACLYLTHLGLDNIITSMFWKTGPW